VAHLGIVGGDEAMVLKKAEKDKTEKKKVLNVSKTKAAEKIKGGKPLTPQGPLA
jgi:hypothetical protein